MGLSVQEAERRSKAPPRTRECVRGTFVDLRPFTGSKVTLTALTLLVGVMLSVGMVCADDGCNWNGSGLDESLGSSSGSSRVVRPLYLRCSQGRIKWSYPRGALRLLLKLSRHSGSTFSNNVQSLTGGQTSGMREFKGCVRVDPDYAGARIYLEGHKRLHLLYAGQNDTRPSQLVRCFVSVRGRAALYVEAEPAPVDQMRSKVKKVAAFQYDLQPIGHEMYRNDFQECRPCSEAELVQNYCTSDFVVKGNVNAMYHNDALERTELTVRGVRVYRDTTSIFSMTSSLKTVHETDPGVKFGVLHRPIKCGTKVGHGDYLFMGNIVLGYPKITCAPRLGDWKRIRRKALLEGDNQCGLD